MANLVFRTTTAGRAALVNAQNTGTLPVVVTQIGVTGTAFVAAADGSDTVLPGELKRLATFGGSAVADDVIHVTIRDGSADVYSMRGFGLYLADGTLLGLYGQAGVILEKSAQATALLAADVKFADINAANIAFGNTDFLNPPATTTVQGVTQYATNPEALTGAAVDRSIVASALKYVLDQRFGLGAPSTFIKGLLPLTTAALLRTAIEIKGAALKDEGEGNGLNADLLDGKHAAEFAASAHVHDAGSITTGVLDAARIPSLSISKVTNLQAALDGKAAVAHTHAIGDVVGLQSALDGKASTTHNHGNSYVKNESGATNDLKLRWDTGMVRLRVDVSEQGGIWTTNNFDPATKSDVGHTHAQLTRGAYLTGNNYNGGSAASWAVDATEAATASKVAARDASGDIHARLFRSEYDATNGTIGFIMTQVDTASNNFIRPSTPAQVKAALAIAAGDISGLDAFVQAKINAALTNYLPKNNPTFTGTMTGPAYNKP